MKKLRKISLATYVSKVGPCSTSFCPKPDFFSCNHLQCSCNRLQWPKIPNLDYQCIIWKVFESRFQQNKNQLIWSLVEKVKSKTTSKGQRWQVCIKR